MVVLCHFWSSHHPMHVMRWLLDFGCSIVVVIVFAVLLGHNLTTAESRAQVWRR